MMVTILTTQSKGDNKVNWLVPTYGSGIGATRSFLFLRLHGKKKTKKNKKTIWRKISLGVRVYTRVRKEAFPYFSPAPQTCNWLVYSPHIYRILLPYVCVVVCE